MRDVDYLVKHATFAHAIRKVLWENEPQLTDIENTGALQLIGWPLGNVEEPRHCRAALPAGRRHHYCSRRSMPVSEGRVILDGSQRRP